MKMTYRNLMCEVNTAPKMNVTIGEFDAETVSYAICRLFTKSEKFCKEYVTESYYKRLAKGKARRAAKHRCVVPAFLAELDGELLQIDFTVDAVGVTIQNVRSIYCRED